MNVAGRRVVLATYFNVARLDWASLFLDSLAAIGVQRAMVLELDGVACEATRWLRSEGRRLGCH